MKQLVHVSLSGVELEGDLNLAAAESGLVIFAHGSGSSRHSPRNRFVAETIRRAGLGTFLFDLLTAEEERVEDASGRLRFNIPFLAERLVAVTRWVIGEFESPEGKIGYFGASTGAAAALVAAAELGERIAAVVSRGGRPDLAGSSLERVRAPTLLLVGGDDGPVIHLNEEAYERLGGKKGLRIIPGASHLFEEPGKLEAVAALASEWFAEHLKPPGRKAA